MVTREYVKRLKERYAHLRGQRENVKVAQILDLCDTLQDVAASAEAILSEGPSAGAAVALREWLGLPQPIPAAGAPQAGVRRDATEALAAIGRKQVRR